MKTPKSQVKLNLKEMSVAEETDFAKLVIESMKNNPNFPEPMPSLDEVQKATEETEKADAQARKIREESQAATSVLHDKADALEDLLTQLGNYVEIASKGDETIIKSAGMDVRKPHTPVGELPKVENVSLTLGDREGELNINWDSVKGARTYVVEITTAPDDENSWKTLDPVTKSSATVGIKEEGIKPGSKVWVRIAAVGAAGKGPWSDMVGRTVA